MDKIYDEECKKLTTALQSYLENKATFDEIIEQANALDLLFKLEDESFINELKEKKFNFVKNFNSKLIEMERKYTKKKDFKIIDVDVNLLLAQAKRFASVCEPPIGYEDVNKFIGPYPSNDEICGADWVVNDE